MKQLYKFLVFVLYFIKNMIYFNKLIDICINRYESQKVVDNYFVGTNDVSVYTDVALQSGRNKGVFLSTINPIVRLELLIKYIKVKS